MKRCPKCNFYMKDNYCVKCGYYEGKSISNLDKYQESNNDLKILLKDDYQKIIYQKNLLLIFLLGPLYFGYYHCCFYSLMFIPVEFIFVCILGMMTYGSLLFIMLSLFVSRISYVIFSNALLIKMLNKRIKKIKSVYSENYKEVLFSMKEKSFFYLIIPVLFYLLVIVIWVIIYRTYRGNW